MNKIFNQAWKYFAAGATVLAYGAWYDSIKTPQKTLEYKNEIHTHINAVQHQLSKLGDQLSSSIDEETKIQIMEKVKELSLDLNLMKAIHNNYFSKFEKGNINADPESSLSLYNKYKEQIDNTFNKANTKANEIVDILNNTKEKFMEDNPIFKIITDYKEYLATLSTIEICLIINITSCVFIFTCIITILLSISGNYLINKFSLEQKLPKLSKIIQLRVKFQNYYVFINSVFIIIAIISLIFVNIITLISYS
jgi:hypothetical protein